MTLSDFEKSSSKALFSYRHSPVYERSFLILKLGKDETYHPVGDYTVLCESESLDLSEMKVVNLISILNERDDLIPLGEKTGTRTLFHYKPRENPEDKTRIVFYELGQEGVSVENAVLTLEPGIVEEDEKYESNRTGTDI